MHDRTAHVKGRLQGEKSLTPGGLRKPAMALSTARFSGTHLCSGCSRAGGWRRSRADLLLSRRLERPARRRARQSGARSLLRAHLLKGMRTVRRARAGCTKLQGRMYETHSLQLLVIRDAPCFLQGRAWVYTRTNMSTLAHSVHPCPCRVRVIHNSAGS